MFLGHFAVGLASKRWAPKAPLAALMAAPLLLDLLWPILLLAGAERVRIDPGNTVVTPLDFQHYPYSHSLLMAAVWSGVFGGGFFLLTRYPRGGWVIAAGVLSHFVLDFVSHRPDLALYPGARADLGLGLWNSLWATLVVEFALLGAGVAVYLSATRPRDRRGTWVLATFVAFIVLVYLGNVFGPPPPSVSAIPYVTLAMWLFLPWARVFDRHRVVKPALLLHP